MRPSSPSRSFSSALAHSAPPAKTAAWQAIDRWLLKAGNDWITAQTMPTTDPPITDTSCFHVQQCAEKSLKAFLTHADVHVEKTHFLPRLIALCRNVDPVFDDLEEAAIFLTDSAVEARYPDDWRDIPLEEALKASEHAEKILNFVRQKLS